jgi:hypothetical protein
MTTVHALAPDTTTTDHEASALCSCLPEVCPPFPGQPQVLLHRDRTAYSDPRRDPARDILRDGTRGLEW